jgi:predicted nuclease of predicted toxin-antitoxin system
MKLLLDQNVSHRLIATLNNTYPDTTQVSLLELGEADDRTIWELALREGFAIVTHDADFEAYSVLAGGPPLVIWLRCGNRPKSVILDKLLAHRKVIEQANADPSVWCVEIY